MKVVTNFSPTVLIVVSVYDLMVFNVSSSLTLNHHLPKDELSTYECCLNYTTFPYGVHTSYQCNPVR